jgi:pantothenate kinase
MFLFFPESRFWRLSVRKIFRQKIVQYILITAGGTYHHYRHFLQQLIEIKNAKRFNEKRICQNISLFIFALKK